MPLAAYARPETEAGLLAALEEMGGAGEGIDLSALGLDFEAEVKPPAADEPAEEPEK